MHLGLHRASMPRLVILVLQIFRHTCHGASKKRLSRPHPTRAGAAGDTHTLSHSFSVLRSAKRGVSSSLLEKRCVHI